MWRVISFYNQNEQLIRTTIKSIVVEIVKSSRRFIQSTTSVSRLI